MCADRTGKLNLGSFFSEGERNEMECGKENRKGREIRKGKPNERNGV